MSIFRNFKVYGRTQFQLRAEATNAFNMVNLNNPNTTYNSSSFGQITGAASMRVMQLGARILF